MFRDENEKVYIEWIELPYFDADGIKGVVDSTTLVDAYSVNNDEVKDYIKKREKNYKIFEEIFAEAGYKIQREHRGSEDGEAIYYSKKNKRSGIFWCTWILFLWMNIILRLR